MGFENFLAGFLGSSPVEMAASLAGFVCVYLIIKRNIWCWPVGLLQVSLYIVVFYGVKLYSDMLLHIVYVFMQVYGWWNWASNKRSRGGVRIVGFKSGDLFIWVVVSIGGSLGLGWLMVAYTDAALPSLDAFTTATSLVAQWLLSRRCLSNWLFWIAVDIVAISIYWQKSLFPTAILYAVFLLMAISGLVAWVREYRGYVPDRKLAMVI